jgi:hypothetical protein
LTNTGNIKPPAHTQRIERWNDLPAAPKPVRVEVTKPDGTTHRVTVSKNQLRVLRGLELGPIYCASFCRIGHFVNKLRDDAGIGIETHWFKNDQETDRAQFGIYELSDTVREVAS